MVAAGIGIFVGLVMLFLGMAVFEQDRKEKKKLREAREKRVAESGAEDLAAALVDTEEPLTYADIRRAKLGAFLMAQGILLTVVCIMLFVLNAYWRPIKWYIDVSVVVFLTIVSLATDAYMMGGRHAEEANEDGQAGENVEVASGDDEQPESDADAESRNIADGSDDGEE